MKFKRNIGTFGLLCASLGGMIGSGWLFGPLFAAQMAGPASVISWIIGGVSIMFLALTFAELASMLPISGGFAAYPVFTHGRLVGFVLTWITWISYVVSISQEVQSTVLYMGNKFPSWIHKIDGRNTFTPLGLLVSFLIMLALISLNSFGTKLLSRSNSLISIWKLLVPFAVVITFLLLNNHPQNFSSSVGTFAPNGITGILSAVALTGVVYSFCGFQHGAILAGEAKNPQRSVPIALIGSILICILLYCGLQYAFITALPQTAIKLGWSHLSFSGDAGPLAGLAATAGITWLVATLYIDAIISPLGTGVLYAASGARIVQSMSNTGNFPRFFASLSKTGTPIRAILLNLVISMLAFLPFDSWQSIVSFLSSALVFSFAVGPICLIALRKQIPEYKRPFALPKYKLLSFIAFYVCNLMVLWAGWSVVWKLAVTVGVGYIVFIIFAFVNKRTQNLSHEVMSSLWLIPYMLGFCILSHLGVYEGGINIIPLGYDFVWMGVFSIIIFYLSQKLCLPSHIVKANMNNIFEIQDKKIDDLLRPKKIAL